MSVFCLPLHHSIVETGWCEVKKYNNNHDRKFLTFVIDLILYVSSAVPSPDLHYGSRTWLNDAHLLVFAARGQQAAVGVEGHAEDDIGVAVDHFHRLPNLQVPDQDLLQLEKQWTVVFESISASCLDLC